MAEQGSFIHARHPGKRSHRIKVTTTRGYTASLRKSNDVLLPRGRGFAGGRRPLNELSFRNGTCVQGLEFDISRPEEWNILLASLAAAVGHSR